MAAVPAKAQVQALFDSLALQYVRERERQYSFVSQKRIALELVGAAYVRLRTLGRRLRGRPGPLSPAHNRCVPWTLDLELAAAGLGKVESRACNFVFFPLQELLPRASESLNRALVPLARWRFATPLGVQYIVKAQKLAWPSASYA